LEKGKSIRCEICEYIPFKEGLLLAIGLLGGTFDPVHNAHICLAQLAKEQLGLEDIILIPTGDPPHKAPRASGEMRLAMTRMAAEEAGFTVSDIEVKREGRTYTVDTLRALHAAGGDRRFVYIIGTDTLYQLPNWREFETVKTLTEFAVIRRVGEDVANAREWADSIGAKVHFIEVDAPDISSTQVRLCIQRDEDISHLVPGCVEKYIREHNLYAPRADLLEKLQETLQPRRYMHTLGVIDTAVRLAPGYGINERQAFLAAALHDCAKSMTAEEMFDLTGADDTWKLYPQTLHAWAGEILAERDYNVFDPEVLIAIRRHTTADRVMTPLDMLIYVADAIEPGRRMIPGLRELRQLAEEDLTAAAKRCAESSYQYNLGAGRTVHPDTLKFLNVEMEDEV